MATYSQQPGGTTTPTNEQDDAALGAQVSDSCPPDLVARGEPFALVAEEVIKIMERNFLDKHYLGWTTRDSWTANGHESYTAST